jgi:nicotinamidase-related amidase
MPVIERARAALLLVDFQSRLMPAIDGGASVVANARRLLDAAQMFDVPVVFTEQNPDGLGPQCRNCDPPPSARWRSK